MERSVQKIKPLSTVIISGTYSHKQKTKMLKKKNVFILIIMIVFLLLSGCSGKPNGEGASSEPFFVNCDSDFVKHGDIIYFYE